MYCKGEFVNIDGNCIFYGKNFLGEEVEYPVICEFDGMFGGKNSHMAILQTSEFNSIGVKVEKTDDGYELDIELSLDEEKVVNDVFMSLKAEAIGLRFFVEGEEALSKYGQETAEFFLKFASVAAKVIEEQGVDDEYSLMEVIGDEFDLDECEMRELLTESLERIQKKSVKKEGSGYELVKGIEKALKEKGENVRCMESENEIVIFIEVNQ